MCLEGKSCSTKKTSCPKETKSGTWSSSTGWGKFNFHMLAVIHNNNIHLLDPLSSSLTKRARNCWKVDDFDQVPPKYEYIRLQKISTNLNIKYIQNKTAHRDEYQIYSFHLTKLEYWIYFFLDTWPNTKIEYICS